MIANQPLAVHSDEDVLALDGQGTPCYFPGEDVPTWEVRAMVFDATAGTFAESGALDDERESFVMAPLPGGEVLVTGGYNDTGVPKSSTRIWEPATGKWVEGALLNIARAGAVATPLVDGTALIVGGLTPGGDATTSAEIYDPAADSWKRVASMPPDVVASVAATLGNGDVVVVAYDEADDTYPIHRYRPLTDTWDNPASLPEPAAAAIPQANGGVLFVGASEQVHRWHPDEGVSVAGSLRMSRPGAAFALLSDGRLLAAGGQAGDMGEGNAEARTTAEVFDPATGQSEAITSMPEPRNHATAITLDDGSVLVVGGWTVANNGDTPWCPELADTAFRWTP